MMFGGSKRVLATRGAGVTKDSPGVAVFVVQPGRRTLTNLYNERPAWLDLAHRRLDAAVLPAYAWPADLSDDDLLGRLLELNLSREPVK